MHPNFDNACQNVVNHVSNAHHAAVAGRSVACVDATSKRLLGRKRLSTQAAYQASDSSSGDRPVMSPSGDRPDMSPRDIDLMSRGERLTRRMRSTRTQTWAAGNEPAAIWAALVIARALAS
jgi:hypothetical protein